MEKIVTEFLLSAIFSINTFNAKEHLRHWRHFIHTFFWKTRTIFFLRDTSKIYEWIEFTLQWIYVKQNALKRKTLKINHIQDATRWINVKFKFKFFAKYLWLRERTNIFYILLHFFLHVISNFKKFMQMYQRFTWNGIVHKHHRLIDNNNAFIFTEIIVCLEHVAKCNRKQFISLENS